MRVSSLNFGTTLMRNLQVNNGKLNTLMTQIAEQKRVRVASDDPVASAQLSQLRREQAATRQYQHNITQVSHSLSLQETQVEGSSDLLLSMLDTLREANSAQHNAEDMGGFAAELETLKSALIAQLNSRDESGRYLFAGTVTDRAPVVRDAGSGAWIYQGNHDGVSTPVSNGVTVPANTDLAASFGDDMKMLNQLETLLGKMANPALPAGSYSADITAMLAQSQTTLDNVTRLFTDLGGRQNSLTLLQDAHADKALIHEELTQQLEGLDMAGAMLDLNRYTLASQAAYKTYGQVATLSLFNLR